ncbi:MAG: hypothetical protein WCE27_19345 [Pseudolabrys sp.]
MSKATAFVAGVLLASMFWIVLAHQSYCAGSVVADWLHMGDVEECRSSGANIRRCKARFGSKADMCSAQAEVR